MCESFTTEPWTSWPDLSEAPYSNGPQPMAHDRTWSCEGFSMGS